MAAEGNQREFEWIDRLDLDVAREARDVLVEVLQQKDLLSKHIVVRPYGPTRIPLQVGEGGDLIRRRAQVVLMLHGRGVLSRAEPTSNGFHVDADESKARRARDLLEGRLHGRPRTVTPSPAMAPAIDFTWIETCDRDLARESWDILDEVLRQMNRLRDPLVISRYPRNTDSLKLTIDYHDRKAEQRWEVVEVLLKRGVLRSAQRVRERDENGTVRESGFRIDADEPLVRRVHKLLEDRLRGHPDAAEARVLVVTPQEMSAPKVTGGNVASHSRGSNAESAPSPRPRSVVPSEFKEGFLKGAGEHAGKWVMGGVIGFLVLVAVLVFKLWKPLFALWGSSHQ